MEETMTKIMYAIPSDLSIQKVIITPACIRGGEPTIVRNQAKHRQAVNFKH